MPNDEADRPVDAPRAYRPVEHWSALHARGSLRSVGQSSLPAEFNAWLYRIGRRNVRSFLARHGLRSLRGVSVFDVGAGTGYWMQLWNELGASQVDGCDLVEQAVERLRARFPGSRLRVGDISDPSTIERPGVYGFVTVMNVLLHILDEARFDAAAANVASAVGPGGWLLLAEPALLRDDMPRQPPPGASSMARPAERYIAAFSRSLDLVAIGPSTVVGANPIERRDPWFRAYDRLWRAASRVSRRGPRWAAAAGFGLAALDRIAMATSASPSGKLLLFRRRVAQPD